MRCWRGWRRERRWRTSCRRRGRSPRMCWTSAMTRRKTMVARAGQLRSRPRHPVATTLQRCACMVWDRLLIMPLGTSLACQPSERWVGRAENTALFGTTACLESADDDCTHALSRDAAIMTAVCAWLQGVIGESGIGDEALHLKSDGSAAGGGQDAPQHTQGAFWDRGSWPSTGTAPKHAD